MRRLLLREYAGLCCHAVEELVIAANRFGKTELKRFNRERMADRHFLNVAAGREKLLEIIKRQVVTGIDAERKLIA